MELSAPEIDAFPMDEKGVFIPCDLFAVRIVLRMLSRVDLLRLEERVPHG